MYYILQEGIIMNLYQVEWSIPLTGHAMMQYTASTTNKKAFSTKEKASEFYKELYDAASILKISGAIQATISEIEIE